MELLKEFTINFFMLANAMSIYILIGLIFAGLLKELLPSNFITRHLGDSSIKSVVKATILGIPMPVCSCSVIPLAKSLQKEGATAGAVQSFLVSTPITGVDSIVATYSFFGLFFAIYRVITSIIIAIVAGVLQNIFLPLKSLENKKEAKFTLSPKAQTTLSVIKFQTESQTVKDSCCSSSSCGDLEGRYKGSFKIKRVFKYAFDTLFSDISKALFIGLIIGAIFSTLMPKDTILYIKDSAILSYILIIFISLPLYVCATSSLPIAASLLMGGIPIGAVFVFLTAGPATNSVTMSVVKDMYGKKALFIYLAVISTLSILFGAILDIYFHNDKIDKIINHYESFSLINYIATAIMFGLMLYYRRRR